MCYNLRSYSGYLLILFLILRILFLFNLDLILLYFLTDLGFIPSFIVSYSFNVWTLFLLKFIKNSKSCLRSYSLDLILSTPCSIKRAYVDVTITHLMFIFIWMQVWIDKNLIFKKVIWETFKKCKCGIFWINYVNAQEKKTRGRVTLSR